MGVRNSEQSNLSSSDHNTASSSCKSEKNNLRRQGSVQLTPITHFYDSSSSLSSTTEEDRKKLVFNGSDEFESCEGKSSFRVTNSNKAPVTLNIPDSESEDPVTSPAEFLE